MPWADVVEGAGADDRQAREAGDLIAEEIGSCFAGGIGVAGAENTIFGEGCVWGGRFAIDGSTADEEDAWLATPAMDGIVEGVGGSEVVGPGILGMMERGTNVSITGEVIDLVGVDGLQEADEGVGLAKVAVDELNAVVEVVECGGPVRTLRVGHEVGGGVLGEPLY